MARNEQLIRQHKILQILEGVRFGRTLNELQQDIVDELGLSSLHTRTLRRDLEALQAAGIDVDSHDSPRGRIWKLGPRAKQTHKISATATELIALSLGRQLLLPLAGTPFWMGIESFWNKIQEEIPQTVISHYEKFRKTLYVQGVTTKSYEKHHGMIKTVNRAILEHRVVEIEYSRANEPATKRFIEPYSIALCPPSLYVVARYHEASDKSDPIRTFKLDRFQKATILDKWFKLPPDLDIEQFMKESTGIYLGSKPTNFKIKVNKKAAVWIQEEPWHPEQKLKSLKDGSVELTVRAAHHMEIIPKVLQLGENAELISPKSARDYLAEVAKKMAEMYS